MKFLKLFLASAIVATFTLEGMHYSRSSLRSYMLARQILYRQPCRGVFSILKDQGKKKSFDEMINDVKCPIIEEPTQPRTSGNQKPDDNNDEQKEERDLFLILFLTGFFG